MLFHPPLKRRQSEVGGGGPMPPPHDERLELRSLGDVAEQNAASRALLSLATSAHDVSNSAQKDKGAAETPSSVAAMNTGITAEEAASVVRSDNDHLDRNYQFESCDEDDVKSFHADFVAAFRAHGINVDNRDPKWMGKSMERAVGVALGKNVLVPVISQFSGLSQSILPGATRFMGMYSRGEFVLRKAGDNGVHQGSFERVRREDAPLMAMWWESDRFLSHTDRSWNEFWFRRCHNFEPGCEMYKFINASGNTLGVVYYERHIADKKAGLGKNGSITLIRGIRVAPSLNPEVLRRRGDLIEDNGTAAEVYVEVASLLFYHVLFTSVRYGCDAVGVNCPKNEAEERFYQSFMGLPLSFDAINGRRYHRIDNQERWSILRRAFHGQVQLWLKQLARSSGEGSSSSGRGGSSPILSS